MVRDRHIVRMLLSNKANKNEKSGHRITVSFAPWIDDPFNRSLSRISFMVQYNGMDIFKVNDVASSSRNYFTEAGIAPPSTTFKCLQEIKSPIKYIFLPR